MTEPATERPVTATATSSSSLSRPAPAPPPPPPSAPAPDNNNSLPPTIAINDSTTTHQPQPFAPIYTLVNNTSTRTTHHPHVRYIFSDDDPDVLTQALAEHHELTAAAELSRSSDPTASSNSNSNSNRAVILDIATDDDGGYHVAWASSLTPSWAVLDAQLSQISPPSSSDGGAENEAVGGGGGGSSGGGGGASINPNINVNTVTNTNTSNNNKPGRLMLRIEGVDCSSSSTLGPESESRLQPGEAHGRAGLGSTASGGSGGSGSVSREREKGPETTVEDYSAIVDEFEKRMVTLRKVVSANEERLPKTEGVEPLGGGSDGEVLAVAAAMGSQPGLEGGGASTAG